MIEYHTVCIRPVMPPKPLSSTYREKLIARFGRVPSMAELARMEQGQPPTMRQYVPPAPDNPNMASARAAIIAKGIADDGMEATALELLDAVGLKAHAHKKPMELSGGQQQRVAIARALALRPRLILADEPTGNLDTHTADDIFALLRTFNRQSNCACLIVTHDPRLAARCDRTVRLVDGRIADDLPTA